MEEKDDSKYGSRDDLLLRELEAQMIAAGLDSSSTVSLDMMLSDIGYRVSSRQKMSLHNDVCPPRKILVVVTVGGSTNSAPILEICKILAFHGHTIEFATLAGRDSLIGPYPFVSRVHVVGRAITPAEDEELYLRYSRWDNTTQSGRHDFIKGKKFYDSFWPETHRGLLRVVADSPPDLIFTDYQVEASRDVARERCIPLVAMWPQMPWMMVPQKWIPGEPGTQLRCLTSEHASLWDRIYDSTYLLRYSPHLLDLLLWTRKMRRTAGVRTMPEILKKPDYLLLVNSFFGLEPAKDLPPLVQAVGPILSDDIPPLDDACADFLAAHTRVAYVAFGTHVILTAAILAKIITGLAQAIDAGHIDGVIWAIRPTARRQLDPSLAIPHPTLAHLTYGPFLDNAHPSWHFSAFAPQRAILAAPNCHLFVTHAGPSSANEALHHGVPMLAMPIYGDQLQEGMRLVAAGVAKSIDKHRFDAPQLCAAVRDILADLDGEFGRNVRRMQRIAHVAARRKYLAADLIEEFMYDWGLRHERDPNEAAAVPVEELCNGGRGAQLSPMHLQTADARMGVVKAKNIDLWLIFLFFCGVVAAAISTGVVYGRRRN